MHCHKYIAGIITAALTASCSPPGSPGGDAGRNVPVLEEVSGRWVSADTAAMEPSIRNFRGQALCNRDMTSVSWFAAAPYSGGYHSGVLRLNGEIPLVSRFRWMPYQSLRKGSSGPWQLESITAMLADRNAIAWKVRITNTSDSEQVLELEIDMIGFIRKYGGDWQWWYPYPNLAGSTTVRDHEVESIRKNMGTGTYSKEGIAWELIDGKPTPVKKILTWPTDKEILDSGSFTASIERRSLIISDRLSEAKTMYRLSENPDSISAGNSGGTAYWNRILHAGETLEIGFLMAWGDEENEIRHLVSGLDKDIGNLLRENQEVWEERWKQIFRPDNGLLSGCFPVLETDDSLARRVYYTGPLTLLYLLHTNLPEHEKVFLTGGPRWGASITFFWDITLWSTLWAVVDPVMMKEHISSWISIDPSKYYGKDNFGGKGVGNGYSANYWALFQLVRSYITGTGDFAFLDERIEGRSVLEHLDDWAMNWQKLSIYGQEGCVDDLYRLADFGDDEWNLLECVPTYKHIVPSFNIGYAWMMRETAKFHRQEGHTERAEEMEQEADSMIGRILELYAGDGVWYSLYPGNKKIEVRHCLDFTFFGKYIPGDIPDTIRKEMMEFLYRELMTDTWMRAQSLRDIAAGNSDRCDHGPLGAFDGWPADIMDALTQMGYPEKALDVYHAIEPVTHEGIWSQAHELWGEDKETKKARVRIAERDWANRESSSGIAMSQVMLKDFFGFNPGTGSNPLQVDCGDPLRTSGTWKFSGKMHHVLYRGEYWSIEYSDGIPVMKKENE